jgi:hypothetical protein
VVSTLDRSLGTLAAEKGATCKLSPGVDLAERD